uniref:Uncharacterized protein n=1 Tax=uncultured prokaryote TaxID=198431 RepID=A0A0H5Q4Q9_9ZZZZ|nr:hypothetical protein [uncultured prokaryote]
MATIREILVDWALPGGNAVSVFWFDAGVAVATQRTALHAFLTGTKAFQATSGSYAIQTAGREVDENTGALTGAWNEASSKTGTGTGGATQLADSSQILVQWRCSVIHNGRFVRGRTFLPGISSPQLSNGNVLAASVASIAALGVTLAGSGAGLQVWSRPVSGAGGLASDVTGATVWNEFAVLRQRRT